ncbi:HNH endonuclease [Kaistia sp. MMO-174]|uniref:HNH endonuclease n=1 Tax=Kaistia sp. MMO-174 TaxID=3081256 RepID=UPI00301886DC
MATHGPDAEKHAGLSFAWDMAKRPSAFRPAHQPTRQEQSRQYDRRRGSARERGYNVRWEKARRTFLARAPLCLGCEAVGRVEPAIIVDHVIPHGGDSDRFWDTAMWQGCCKWHHDVVKQRLEDLFARGNIAAASLHLDSAEAIAMTRALRSNGL